jgi:hypothetical protein
MEWFFAGLGAFLFIGERRGVVAGEVAEACQSNNGEWAKALAAKILRD